MRKKLFAVIMSAMMMITFMPAMAFAANMDAPVTKAAKTGFYVSGMVTTNAARTETKKWVDNFTYDGKEHTVTFVAGTVDPENMGQQWMTEANAKVVGYSMKFRRFDGFYPTKATPLTNAPVVKEAGEYTITATVDWVYQAQKYSDEFTFVLSVGRRTVNVSGLNQIIKTKDYDGEPVVIDGKELTVDAFTDGDGKTPYYYGLAEGDSLFTKTIKTGTDAGVYYYSFEKLLNPNYYVANWAGTNADVMNRFVIVTINKADNAAKIASQEMTIKRGSSKAVKFSATFGTAKLTKLSGNTKISVKNGKIKVAKSCKKGTFKVKVKASTTGTANYAAANRVKTLTIVVK